MKTETTEVLEIEETETTETETTQTTEINYVCECEHIDYTDQLETLILQNEYIANSNAQILTTNLFIISFILGVGVCVILYKFLKIFF